MTWITDGKVYVWHRESGSLLEELSGHGEGSVNSVAWSPRNERMFASCSDDRTVRIWESPVSIETGHGRVGRLGSGGASGVGRNGFGAAGTGMSNGKGKGKSVVRQRPWEGTASGGASGSGVGGGGGITGMGDETMVGDEGSSVTSS